MANFEIHKPVESLRPINALKNPAESLYRAKDLARREAQKRARQEERERLNKEENAQKVLEEDFQFSPNNRLSFEDYQQVDSWVNLEEGNDENFSQEIFGKSRDYDTFVLNLEGKFENGKRFIGWQEEFDLEKKSNPNLNKTLQDFVSEKLFDQLNFQRLSLSERRLYKLLPLLDPESKDLRLTVQKYQKNSERYFDLNQKELEKIYLEGKEMGPQQIDGLLQTTFGQDFLKSHASDEQKELLKTFAKKVLDDYVQMLINIETNKALLPTMLDAAKAKVGKEKWEKMLIGKANEENDRRKEQKQLQVNLVDKPTNIPEINNNAPYYVQNFRTSLDVSISSSPNPNGNFEVKFPNDKKAEFSFVTVKTDDKREVRMLKFIDPNQDQPMELVEESEFRSHLNSLMLDNIFNDYVNKYHVKFGFDLNQILSDQKMNLLAAQLFELPIRNGKPDLGARILNKEELVFFERMIDLLINSKNDQSRPGNEVLKSFNGRIEVLMRVMSNKQNADKLRKAIADYVPQNAVSLDMLLFENSVKF